MTLTCLILSGAELALGAGRGAAGQPAHTPGPPQEYDKQPRTMPKEWSGRWRADPFVGTEWLEVWHATEDDGPGAVRYQLKEPQAVAAVLKTLKIIAIQNDVAVGGFPTARLTFHKKDGTSLQVDVETDGSLSTPDGLIHVRRAFFEALNRQITTQQKRQVNVLQPVPAPPQPPQPDTPPVPPSARSLTAGFTSLSVQYTIGQRLHQATITDRKTLDELHKSLTIVQQRPAGEVKPPAHLLTIVSRDKSRFHGHILSGTEFFDYEAGRFTVRPEFLQALASHVSQLEGHPIDLVGVNALTETQLEQERAIRRLLASVKALRFPSRKGSAMLTIDDPRQVAQLIQNLRWIEVPSGKINPEKGNLLVELTLRDGRKIPVHSLRAGAPHEPAVAVTECSLVEIAGVGPVWLDAQWQSRLQDEWEMVAGEQRRDETTRLVCRNLPAFFKQVRNVVAHYHQKRDQRINCLSVDESRPFLEALAAAKVEPLPWSDERWTKELQRLTDRGAATLDLTPGLGYFLIVVVSGEQEMLIPDYGRVTFSQSPLPALQRALAGWGGKAKRIRLLPR
jgi:hypothetical protein